MFLNNETLLINLYNLQSFKPFKLKNTLFTSQECVYILKNLRRGRSIVKRKKDKMRKKAAAERAKVRKEGPTYGAGIA